MKKVLFIVFLLQTMMLNAQNFKLPSGIEYKYFKKGKTTRLPKKGDYVTLILKGTCGSQVFVDTRKINKGQNLPVNFPFQKASYNGDVMEVIAKLHVGDSVRISIPQDSFYRRMPQVQRKGVRAGEPVIYLCSVHNILSKAEFDKLQAEYKKYLADVKKQEEAIKKQQVLMKKEDALMKAYFKKDSIVAQVTPGGVYYHLIQKGEGELPKPNDLVKLNYQTYLLNGKKIDSNTDTLFHHVEVLKVQIGRGMVIPGLEESINRMPAGSIGTFLIPSRLAFGENIKDSIPANSILRYELELLSITNLDEIDKKNSEEINNYISTKENTEFIQFKSGLYYSMTKVGEGENIKSGDTVLVNYSGYFLDGRKFDSNTDSLFGHVQPIEVIVGNNNVIKGWEEGLTFFNKNSKGTLIIPSKLGYGYYDKNGIPENSVLVFDMEIVDIKPKIN